MKKWFMVLAIAGSLSAQSLEETAAGAVNTLAPSLSPLLVGEHLATANTLGSLPHLRVGIGVNFAKATFQNPAANDSIEAWVPFPFLMADVGVFPGLSLTPLITGVGSIDLIGKFSVFPGLENASEYIKNVPAFWAIGARIGLLKDHLWSPAAAITVIYGNFSPFEMQGGTPEGDSVYLRAGFNATGLYLQVSKNVLVFTPYLSLGWVKGTPSAEYKTPANENYISLSGIESVSEFRTLLGVELSPIPFIKVYGEVMFVNNQTMFSVGLRGGI